MHHTFMYISLKGQAETTCFQDYVAYPRCNIIYDFLFFILFLFRFRLHHRHCFAIVMSAVRDYTGDEPIMARCLL